MTFAHLFWPAFLTLIAAAWLLNRYIYRTDRQSLLNYKPKPHEPTLRQMLYAVRLGIKRPDRYSRRELSEAIERQRRG